MVVIDSSLHSSSLVYLGFSPTLILYAEEYNKMLNNSSFEGFWLISANLIIGKIHFSKQMEKIRNEGWQDLQENGKGFSWRHTKKKEFFSLSRFILMFKKKKSVFELSLVEKRAKKKTFPHKVLKPHSKNPAGSAKLVL